VTSAEARFQALVLDFGGVLTSPLAEAMERFGAGAGIELTDLVRAALGAYMGAEDPLVTEFECGRMDEAEFSRAFADRLRTMTGREVDPEGIVGRLFDVRIEDDMLVAVGRVRDAGLKTAVLSNSWGRSLYPSERLAALFDAVVLSGDVGVRKPDPAIFRLATQRLGVAAPACVFVDDHPGHLEAAAAEGMTTVLHTTVAATVAELERLLGLELHDPRASAGS
jgi:putative hydrolase of the HAD superfamily